MGMTLSSSDDRKTELAFFNDDYRPNEWSLSGACATHRYCERFKLREQAWTLLPELNCIEQCCRLLLPAPSSVPANCMPGPQAAGPKALHQLFILKYQLNNILPISG
jgi:hypothetical protein